MSSRREIDEGRGFGVGIGALVVVASGIAWIRGGAPPMALAALSAGVALLLIGFVRPAWLAGAARRWSVVAEAVAGVGNAVALGLVFFLVVTPIAIVLRVARYDPLDRRSPRRSSYWRSYPERQADRRHYERMA